MGKKRKCNKVEIGDYFCDGIVVEVSFENMCKPLEMMNCYIEESKLLEGYHIKLLDYIRNKRRMPENNSYLFYGTYNWDAENGGEMNLMIKPKNKERYEDATFYKTLLDVSLKGMLSRS